MSDITYSLIGTTGDPLPAEFTKLNGTFQLTPTGAQATGIDPSGVKWLATVDSGADGTFSADVNMNSSTAGTTGVVCRCTDVDNLFMAVLNPNNATLRLYKRESGNYTTIGSVYTVPAFSTTISYVISIVTLGTSIKVQVDGVDVITNAGSQSFNQNATKAGIRVGDTAHRVLELTAPDASLSDSITISTSDFAFTKAINGEGSIDIVLNYTGTPDSISRSIDGGVYEVVVTNPSGGVASDTVTLSTGQYNLSYRFTNDILVTDTVNYITIAKHVFSCGFQAQSNMQGRGNNNQTYNDSPSGFKACMFNDSGEFTELSDPWQGWGGSWFIRFVNSLYADDNGPIAVVTGAEGGTSAAEWAKGSTLYDTLLNRCLSVGGVTRNFMQQGERDSILGTTATNYAIQTNANINNVFNDLGVDTFIVPLQTITATGYDGNGTTTGQDAIRSEQISIAATNDHAEIGSPVTSIDLSSGDGLHFTTDSQLQDLSDLMYASFTGATSVLSMTNTGTPDGVYSMDIFNTVNKTLIETKDVTFSGGDATINISTSDGTRVFAFVDSLTPSTSGICYVGETI